MSRCECGAWVRYYEDACHACGLVPANAADLRDQFWAGLRAIGDRLGEENLFPALQGHGFSELDAASVQAALARIEQEARSEMRSQQGGW